MPLLTLTIVRRASHVLGDRSDETFDRGDVHHGQFRIALATWERIDARFERACTLLLLPGRTDEGMHRLAKLACVPPKT